MRPARLLPFLALGAMARKCAVPLLVAAAIGGGLAVASPEGAWADRRELVGRSLQGRPIVALREVATGGAQLARRQLGILVVGSIHGDETAGMPIARRLVTSAPPRGVTLWVVPTLNPDGVAAGSRGNARGVDLNRNFPIGWRPLGGLEYSGRHPLSEPESRAARRLVLRLRPDVTIWFHQPFGLVDRPEGDPFAARRYASLAGLPLVRLRRYPGSATRWQHQAFPRSTAFVVELPAVTDGALIRRATGAVRTLARELAGPRLGAAAAVP